MFARAARSAVPTKNTKNHNQRTASHQPQPRARSILNRYINKHAPAFKQKMKTVATTRAQRGTFRRSHEEH
jgi:hypothetical protein